MGSEPRGKRVAPGAESLILATDSVQGMDAFVTLHGMLLGVQSDIDLEMVFDVTETTGSISEIDAIARYAASSPYLVYTQSC